MVKVVGTRGSRKAISGGMGRVFRRLIYTDPFIFSIEMPALNSKLHTWQHNQLGNGHSSLNAKIQKELAENEGRTYGVIEERDLIIVLRKRNAIRLVTSGSRSVC